MTASEHRPLTFFEAYRMRWKRRRLLWRSFRSRRQLKSVNGHTEEIQPSDILVFGTVRNEIERMQHFLDHYRALGVAQFLLVDNGSDDGTLELLKDQQDVSLWTTNASYRSSRFGMDWVTWLLLKYGHGHWCLTVDADELFDFAESDELSLPELSGRLDKQGRSGFGALLLDLYPKASIGSLSSDANALANLEWFDPGPYRSEWQYPMRNLWVQGGARERVFFAEEPSRSPTLNKIPLVKWNRRYCYVNSTHSLLPPYLNLTYDGPGGKSPSGVLLHTKFMPSIVSKSETERQRAEHFTHPEKFSDYYDRIDAQPSLWTEASIRYEGPEQLEKLGLISRISKPSSLI